MSIRCISLNIAGKYNQHIKINILQSNYVSHSNSNFLRYILNHNIKATREWEKEELKKGFVSPVLFEQLCKVGLMEKEGKTLKRYLLALDLAVELQNGTLFIPSLVSGEKDV